MRSFRIPMLLALSATALTAGPLIAQVPARPPTPAGDSTARDSTARDSTTTDSTTRISPGIDSTRTDSAAVVGEGAPEPAEPAARWRTSWFPYLAGGANDSPVLSFRLRHWQAAEYEARSTYTAAFNADAGIAPKGSRYVSASFRAPEFWTGWRLVVQAAAERQARLGYFGLGNNTVFDKDADTPEMPFLYRMRRTRYRVTAEVTRQIRGPLQVALLTAYTRARFTALPGPSTFLTDNPSGDFTQHDVSGRLALIYDTRDNEYNTHQGLLLEAGSQVGSGNDGYTRQYAILRGYLSVREGTVLAARIAGSGMGGRPSLDARFVLPGWEREIPVLGGEYSHRGLDYGRLTGRGTLFGNFEVRHDLLPLGDLGAVTLLAFLDAGRVFENEDFKLTTENMKVGGGGGIGLRILRSSIFVFNYARGPDGGNFSVGTGWMF
jgi:outer membrane protein assembly factor BamA